jgi:small subunit ribosomal protein S6
MRNYEIALIADPELNETTLSELEEKVIGWIEAVDGKVIEVDHWGKRRLAYPIQKKNEGYYFFVNVEMPPQASHALERDLRITEPILRYMITLQ